MADIAFIGLGNMGGPMAGNLVQAGHGVIAAPPEGALLIDCSTIDVATAREVHQAAAAVGRAMLDVV